MKVSDITTDFVKDFCGVSGSDNDTLLAAELAAAKVFVVGYTAIASDDLDDYEDITIAVLCLVNDMFNSREVAVDNGAVNPIVKQILGLHAKNYL